MRRPMYRCDVTWIGLLLCVAPALGQSQDQFDQKMKEARERNWSYNTFLQNYVSQTVVPEVLKARAGQADPTKEAQTPSNAESPISLIDKSSVPDLISLATNLAGLQTSSGSANQDTSSSSVTVTASALKAYLSGQDPLDPFVYNRDREWRRFSFTLGHDAPDDPNAADALLKRGSIYGIKYRFADKRDAADGGNAAIIKSVSDALMKQNLSYVALRRETLNYLTQVTNTEESAFLADWRNKIKGPDSNQNGLDSSQKQRFTEIVVKYVDAFIAYKANVKEALDAIRRKKQFALAYEAKNRTGNSPDDYRALLTYDVGYLTANLSYGREASFSSGAFSTSTGMKFGAEYRVPLDKPDELSARRPRVLSFSAVADGAAAPRVYKAQAKLTIPISDGIEIPLSLTAANRSEFINEGKIKGRIGFTFDLSKLKVENILDRAKADNNMLQATNSPPTPAPAVATPPTPAMVAPPPVDAAPATTSPAAASGATRPFNLRVCVLALDPIFRPAPNLTVEVLDGTQVVASERTDANDLAFLSIPNYGVDAARRFTVRIKYFERVLETSQVSSGQAHLAVQIGPQTAR